MNLHLLAEVFLTFLKIGIVMFGGGHAMIPLLRHELVIRRQWLTEQELIDVIAVAESTPGPIAINSATYVGYKVGGIVGAVLATLAVVLPAFIIMLSVTMVLMKYYTHYIVRGALYGIRATVIGLVLSALVVIIRGAVRGGSIVAQVITIAIAVATFVSITVANVDPVILIAVSICLGLVLALLKIW